MSARNLIRVPAFFVLYVAACLTVNVYIYPSKEVDATAQKLIEDIRGEVIREHGQEIEGDAPSKAGDPQGWLFPGSAHADEKETSVTSPAIESLKAALKNRAPRLAPYFDAGAIGEGNDGFVAVRDASTLPMKDRAGLNRLVKEENDDRAALYREVAKELKVEKQDMPRLQESFAREWQKFARPGWWVQTSSGAWEKHK